MSSEIKIEIPVLDHGYVKFLDYMGSDSTIVGAARISYRGHSKGVEADKKLLAYLLKNKHTSPFEMAKIVFQVKMPIFVMRQWVRHRMQNLNEVSARYTELPNQFYLPKIWRVQDTKNKQGSVTAVWDKPIDPLDGQSITQHEIFTDEVGTFYKKSYELYISLIDRGIAREMARMVLPVGIYTEIVCCWDLHNLMHFLRLREDSHAQSEIQEYARAMKQIAAQLFPWTFEIYDSLRIPDMSVKT